MDRTACTEPQCLYSTAIPLLPLWAVRPVQTLSACTVQLYLYLPQCLYSTAIPLLPSVPLQYSYTSTPPMGRTVCRDPQCLYSTAIPLLPLWAVRPVQTLSTCSYVKGCTLPLLMGLYVPWSGVFDMIYLLTAMRLTSSGNSTVRIYTYTIHKTTPLTQQYKDKHN